MKYKGPFLLMALAFSLMTAAWLISSCAVKDNTGVKARIASDETTTSGDAEGFMGPVYGGPYSPVTQTQTTIGTVALGSGWFCLPVVVLALAAARVRRRAVDRLVCSVEFADIPSVERTRLKQWVRSLRPFSGKYHVDDGPERFIARSVRRLKRRFNTETSTEDGYR